MKKLIIALVCLFTLQGIAKADSDKPIEVKELPQKALTFMNKHFADIKVSYAKLEEDIWEKKYEVVMVNGQKMEFDKNGEWLEVDCKFSSVPEAIIPAEIKVYLKQHFPEQKTIKIERDKRGYEVKLTNKLEITFDKKFRAIDIDD